MVVRPPSSVFRQRLGGLVAVGLGVLAWAGGVVPAIAQEYRLVHSDPLVAPDPMAGALGKRVAGGEFTPRGWRALGQGDRLTIDVGEAVGFEGAFQIDLLDLRWRDANLAIAPNSKIDFLAMSSDPEGEHHAEHGGAADAALWALRGGAENGGIRYGDGFKVLWASHGAKGAPGADYREQTLKKRSADGGWTMDGRRRTLRVRWSRAAETLVVEVDGVQVFQGPWDDQVRPLRYVHLSKDGDFGTLMGPIFSNLRVYAAEAGSPVGRALPGQLVVDPANGSALVYNRDADRDGRLDPAYLIGPGDPETFLHLGERSPTGPRLGGGQAEILETMRRHGGNALYIQAVRSHGGDGGDDHNPWNDPADPTSGLDPDIVRQWRDWLETMRAAGINVLFFIYDDGVHPFDDGCTGGVGAAEEAFIRDLVNALEDFPNLMWVVQEEFKFVGTKPEGQHWSVRRKCDDARVAKAREVARLIASTDDYDHPIGVHHNIGEDMAFPDDPHVEVYLQQADVRPRAGKGTIEAMHAAGVPPAGYDAANRYVYVMAEGFDLHHDLMEAGDREGLRKSYYASALAGGYVTVLGMYGAEGPPTVAMLQDMRRMRDFFESVPYNRLAPRDDLAHGGTRWVLAAPGEDRYLLYSPEATKTLGVKRLRPGRYTLRWFDPADGDDIALEHVHRTAEDAEDAVFHKPPGIGDESLLWLGLVR